MNSRTLTGVTLYLTNDCNLRCRHCWISGGEKKEYLNTEYVIERIDEAVLMGVKDFLITGGEPFLHKDINKIISHIMSYSGVDLSIETNAVIISGENIELLKKYSSRIFVCASLDGSNAEMHDSIRGCRGAFEKTVHNIKRLNSIGCFNQCIMAVNKINCFDIKNVIELCIGLGIKSLRVLPVQPCGRGLELDSMSYLFSTAERIEFYSQMQEYIDKYQDKISVNTPIPPAFQKMYRIRKYRNECSFCHRLTLLANGKYSTCGIGEVDADFQFGVPYKTSISECWNNCEQLKDIFYNVENNLSKPCSLCIFRHICRGFCMANAVQFPFKEEMGYNFCAEAYDMGLFPNEYLEKGVL